MYWNDEAGTLTVACWSQELQCSSEYFLLISTVAAYIIIRLHCMQCKLQCKKDGSVAESGFFFISRVLFRRRLQPVNCAIVSCVELL